MKKTANRQARHSRNKQEKQALSSLKRQAKTPPREARAGIEPGDKLVAARQWHDAIHCYRVVLEQDDRNVMLLTKIAYAYASGGFTDDAIRTYEVALALDPKNIVLLRNLGAIFNDTGMPDRALTYLERALSQNPKDADAHYLLAEAFRRLKQKKNSAIQFMLAVPLFQDQALTPSVLIKVGRSLAFLKRFDSAINFLEEASTLAPDMPGAHFELALVYVENGNLDKAAKLAYHRGISTFIGGSRRRVGALPASHQSSKRSHTCPSCRGRAQS